jgi:hypothetical protein
MTECIEIPGHNDCIKKLRTSLFRRTSILLGVSAFAAIIAIYFDLSKGWMMIIGLLAPITYGLWWVNTPLPFEFSISGERKIESFADENYAKTFASWNNAKIE